ncbi:MAG: phosphoribosyltransferase, partial [Gemmatimonadales bacterium]|nr:phosphoribosyltransferase [Gemmatimonadales bacterium]
MHFMRFPNRAAAGRRLAELLAGRAELDQVARPLVLGLPRGGISVGYELARALGVPLDVLVARRLWAPGQPELAIGAVAPGVRVLHEVLIAEMGISVRYVDCAVAEQILEVERATLRYRAERPPLELADRAVLLVDDGLASGATAAAALQAARRQGPRHLVFATPVASTAGLRVVKRRGDADEVWCLCEVSNLGMVSEWYEDFSP